MHRPPPQLPDDKKQGVDDYLAACGRLEKLEVIGGQLPVADRARAKQVLRHAEENGIKPPRFFERALMVLTAIFARAENGTYKLTRKLLVRATNSDFALVRRCLEDLRETGLITSDVSLEMEPVKTKKGTYYHFPQGPPLITLHLLYDLFHDGAYIGTVRLLGPGPSKSQVLHEWLGGNMSTIEIPTDDQLAEDVERLMVLAEDIFSMAACWQARFPSSSVLQSTVDWFLRSVEEPRTRAKWKLCKSVTNEKNIQV